MAGGGEDQAAGGAGGPREQLLDAAAQVFLDRGLAQATVADVAEAAGLAKHRVYLYFDSKSALLTALRAATPASGWPSPAAWTHPGRGGYRQRLRSFLGRCTTSMPPTSGSTAALPAAEVSEDEPLEQARADLVRFVTRGADAGEFAVGDPEATASFLLLDGVHGLLLRSLHAGRSRRCAGRRLATVRPPARRRA